MPVNEALLGYYYSAKWAWTPVQEKSSLYELISINYKYTRHLGMATMLIRNVP